MRKLYPEIQHIAKYNLFVINVFHIVAKEAVVLHTHYISSLIGEEAVKKLLTTYLGLIKQKERAQNES